MKRYRDHFVICCHITIIMMNIHYSSSKVRAEAGEYVSVLFVCKLDKTKPIKINLMNLFGEVPLEEYI